MTATIQTIETPKRARALDTSGNNNHGQIYSGRALEFDGVTDYFQHNGGTAITGVNSFANGSPWTFACWMYFDSGGASEDHIIGADFTSQHHFLFNHSSSEIRFRDANADYYAFSSTKLNTNTWYRIVITTDGTSMTAYVNGIVYGTIAAGQDNLADPVDDNFDTTEMKFTGWGMPYQSGSVRANGFMGMMSDGQVWDANWTQDDVTYDYLTPESIALNRGGTYLTNSNLKIWYPMQDGHRGNQSYILDASNTGLGDELATWAGEDVDVSAYVSIEADTTAALVVGTTYKVAFTVSNYTSGSFRFRQPSGGVDLGSIGDANGDYVQYGTATNTTELDCDAFNLGFEGTISNISVKPVNAKSNATTAFFGDELIASDAADNRTFDNDTGNWAIYDASGSDVEIANASNKLQVTTQTTDEIEGAQLAIVHIGDGSTTSIVAGRSYRVSMDLDLTTPGSGTFSMTIGLGGTLTSAFNIGTNERAYTKDIIATNNTGALLIYNSSSTASVFTVDNVSVKEVGLASGWTDADQQLHIPQTALQSYNELGMFLGVDDGTDSDVSCGSNASIDDVFDGGGTVSAWIYPFSDGPAGTAWIVAKSKWIFYLNSESGGKVYLRHQATTDGDNQQSLTAARDITLGQWQHVVMTYNASSPATPAVMYINGDEVVVDESQNGTGTRTADAGDDLIIGNAGDGTTTFGGCITEVSLWDATLTLAQVQELYNAGKALDATKHSVYDSAATNLKGYWRNNGLSTWTDLSTYSNNGTVNNVTETLLIPSGVDGSRDSQGFIMNKQRNTSSLNLTTRPGDYVEASADGSLDFGANPFSIECWVKFGFVNNSTFGETGSTLNVILSNGRADVSVVDGFNLLTISNDFIVRMGDGGGSNLRTYTIPGTPVIGNWYHIVVTRSGTTIETYVDGEDVGGETNAGWGSDITTTNPLRIGDDSLSNRDYKQPIDGVRIYSDVLSGPEVLRNYNTTKGSHRN